MCLSEEKYTCLLDFVKSIYKESCSGPRTEPPGKKYLLIYKMHKSLNTTCIEGQIILILQQFSN